MGFRCYRSYSRPDPSTTSWQPSCRLLPRFRLACCPILRNVLMDLPGVLIHSEPGASSGPQYSRTPTLRTTGYHLPNADHSAASQDHHVTVMGLWSIVQHPVVVYLVSPLSVALEPHVRAHPSRPANGPVEPRRVACSLRSPVADRYPPRSRAAAFPKTPRRR